MANKRTAELSRAQRGGSRAASPATGRSETSSNSGKAPSPSDPPKSQIDFQFLNFSHPGDAKASSARKAVRSHVTKQQHAKEQRLQHERRTQSYQGPSTEADSPVLPRRPHAETFPLERPTTLELPSGASTSASTSTKSSPESSPASRSPSASPTSPPEQRLDFTQLYPAEWLPYIRPLLEYYASEIAVEDPYIDGPQAKGLLRTRFLPFVLTDAAALHALLLLSASHQSRVRGPGSHPIDLLRLQGMAIGEINRALADMNRATSNALIAAVAKMARYEALFGDRNVFNTHMTGLLRIVALRGGLVNLGMDGLLERLLLWTDSNSAYILGSRVYFDPGAYPASIVHPRPDPVRFSAGMIRAAR